jgi:signal transduction histidine kinase
MHDSLSHHLSVIATYSGALSVRKDLDPEEVRTTARLIADSARRSGVELREVLTMLRSDDQGTVIDPDLDRLVART